MEVEQDSPTITTFGFREAQAKWKGEERHGEERHGETKPSKLMEWMGWGGCQAVPQKSGA